MAIDSFWTNLFPSRQLSRLHLACLLMGQVFGNMTWKLKVIQLSLSLPGSESLPPAPCEVLVDEKGKHGGIEADQECDSNDHQAGSPPKDHPFQDEIPLQLKGIQRQLGQMALET